MSVCMLCQCPGARHRSGLGALCDRCMAAASTQVADGGDLRAALCQLAGRLVVAASSTIAVQDAG